MKFVVSAAVFALALSAATALSASTPTADDFRHKAMASDAFEIASSKLALKNSESAKVHSFARLMIRDHTKTTEHLLQGSGMTKADVDKKIAPGPDGKFASNDLVDQTHADSLNKLASGKGKDFDSDYASGQVSGHKDAVAMFGDYAKNGDDKSLKAWAKETLPTLKMHLSRAEALNGSATK
jgi:putative membrane protein